MIPAIDDEQEISMMVERQASRIVELANIFAWLLGADRELDSSISAKRIVFHLKLSPTRDTRHERDTKYKQATSNKKQQEPIDEGTKNSTSLLNQPLPHSHEPLLDDAVFSWYWYWYWYWYLYWKEKLIEIDTMIDEGEQLTHIEQRI